MALDKTKATPRLKFKLIVFPESRMYIIQLLVPQQNWEPASRTSLHKLHTTTVDGDLVTIASAAGKSKTGMMSASYDKDTLQYNVLFCLRSPGDTADTLKSWPLPPIYQSCKQDIWKRILVALEDWANKAEGVKIEGQPAEIDIEEDGGMIVTIW